MHLGACQRSMMQFFCKDTERLLANYFQKNTKSRNSHPEVFLGKDVLKICSKFTREHPCRSVISIKLLSHICKFAAYFQNTFTKNNSGWLPLKTP